MTVPSCGIVGTAACGGLSMNELNRMDREWMIFTINMKSRYQWEYLESLSDEELKKLYEEQERHG